MVDFRKFVFVLVAVALFAFTASAASTTFSCTANASVNTLIRAEGITELLGDVVLNCNGGTPTALGAPIPMVNLQVSVPTGVNITSRPTALATEALLLIDEPNGANPNNTTVANVGYMTCDTVTCQGLGDGNGGFQVGGATPGAPSTNYYGNAVAPGVQGGNRNTFQGVLQSPQQLIWIGVPIDPPGPNFTRVIRITNIRVNATGYFTAGGTGSFPIGVTLNPTPSFALPILNPVNIAVANVQNGLTFSVSDLVSGWRQCVSKKDATFAGYLKFQENFLSSFKKRIAIQAKPFNNYLGLDQAPTWATLAPQSVPGGIYWSESGLMPVGNSQALPLGGVYANVGYADQGTRLKAVFNSIPKGASVYVATYYFKSGTDPVTGVANTVLTAARLVSSADGSFATRGSVADGIVKIADGTVTSASAVWEVLQANPFEKETIQIAFGISYTADPGNNSPEASVTAKVNGSFAPISTVTTSSSAAPIPRFADTSTATDLFMINMCVTNLLFPYVTSQSNFDTGLAISNTSTDPWKTTPQTGTCDVYHYGENAPAMLTIGPVPSGDKTTWLTSIVAPNFNGYVISICRFQFGHGFAFISDFGATQLAMGYLALVVPEDAANGRKAQDSAISQYGEMLGQ